MAWRHRPRGAACCPWVALAAVIVLIDQLTKIAIERAFDYGDVHPITGVFNRVLTYNRGAAFSFLASASGWQKHFLTVVGSGRRCSSSTCWPATEASGCFRSRSR